MDFCILFDNVAFRLIGSSVHLILGISKQFLCKIMIAHRSIFFKVLHLPPSVLFASIRNPPSCSCEQFPAFSIVYSFIFHGEKRLKKNQDPWSERTLKRQEANLINSVLPICTHVYAVYFAVIACK